MKFNFKKNKMGNKSFSQINVTPFVDVMLVLLIVFMITAPLLTVGVKVDLPKTKASQLNQKGDPDYLAAAGRWRKASLPDRRFQAQQS